MPAALGGNEALDHGAIATHGDLIERDVVQMHPLELLGALRVESRNSFSEAADEEHGVAVLGVVRRLLERL